MERAVEWFVAVTSAVVGLSHLLRPGDWADAFRRLHECGPPGAFVNGGLTLAGAAGIVAGHGSWAWPGAVLAVDAERHAVDPGVSEYRRVAAGPPAE
jgi:hypothetical protein